MRIFLFFLLLFVYGKLYCQQLITDDSITLKKGFYRHFYEFKYNKPSLSFDYKIDTCSENYDGLKINRTNVSYMITPNKDQFKFLRDIYGFCDSKYIYTLIYHLPPISSKLIFAQLIFKGRYCIFGVTSDKGKISISIPGGPIVNIQSYDQLVIIDMNNGEFIHLKEKTLKNILKDDKDLSNRYKLEKNKEKKLADYLIEYSLKHKNEIKINEQDVTPGEINEILKKSPTDTTFDIYYGRVIEKLKKIRDISNIEIWQSKYSNGNYKFIGLSAVHKLSINDTYNYKIGYWRYFYQNGEIQKEIIYDLTENKIFEKEFDLKKKN